mmetsp:Transcript_10048/g.22574  ORF Transcript_10048/g.22574 Transcript_10048/m.22574 type:complete len:121 (+) Transcript_10048:435-797(+)
MFCCGAAPGLPPAPGAVCGAIPGDVLPNDGDALAEDIGGAEAVPELGGMPVEGACPGMPAGGIPGAVEGMVLPAMPPSPSKLVFDCRWRKLQPTLRRKGARILASSAARPPPRGHLMSVV